MQISEFARFAQTYAVRLSEIVLRDFRIQEGHHAPMTLIRLHKTHRL